MKVKKMSTFVLILLSIALAVFGQLFMKKGMSGVGSLNVTEILTIRMIKVVLQPFVLMGLLLYLTSAAFWLIVLSNAELSYAYPLVGVGYVLTAILAKIFFNENLTLFRFFGIILIVVGALLIYLKI
jgi:multidrug transporter EmrE-like cation transporter